MLPLKLKVVLTVVCSERLLELVEERGSLVHGIELICLYLGAFFFLAENSVVVDELDGRWIRLNEIFSRTIL